MLYALFFLLVSVAIDCNAMHEPIADFKPEETIDYDACPELTVALVQFCEADEPDCAFDALKKALALNGKHSMPISLNPIHLKTGKSLACHCLKAGKRELFNSLCARGADLNVMQKQKEREEPLLHWIVRKQPYEVIADALRCRVDPCKTDDRGQNALHIAAVCPINGAKVCKLLIDTYGMHVNQKSKLGATPLFFAACVLHKQTVKILLERRANKEIIDDVTKKTPLAIAKKSTTFFKTQESLWAAAHQAGGVIKLLEAQNHRPLSHSSAGLLF